MTITQRIGPRSLNTRKGGTKTSRTFRSQTSISRTWQPFLPTKSFGLAHGSERPQCEGCRLDTLLMLPRRL